jgi:DNA-binding MarR family transcriptional regulator/GNAT superfamily N-acetyltransferase
MSASLDTIDAIRAFSRFFTSKLGVVGPNYLGTTFTLTDARIMFETRALGQTTATDLVRDLKIDPAYLSRIIRRFCKAGLMIASRDVLDGRRQILKLTNSGQQQADHLISLARNDIISILGNISTNDSQALKSALHTVERLMAGSQTSDKPIILRDHRPGDMGWIVESQASFYTAEFGWNNNFEALVAEVSANLLKRFNPERERIWIAEQDSQRVGSIVIADGGCNVAKLRLLYVDHAARGSGLGRRLVEEGIEFARNTGYTKISLWTNNNLDAARAIYRRTGFKLVAAVPHSMFGPELVGETWELGLIGRDGH